MSTLVVTDLDGTLWDHSDRCHPRTLEAVDELRRQGTALLVATGRRQRGVEIGFEINGLSLPAVMLNGAMGFDFRTNESVFVEKFQSATIAALVAGLAEVGLFPALQLSPDRVVVQAGPTVAAKYISAVRADIVRTDDLIEFVSNSQNHVVGLVLMSMTASQLKRCRAVMQRLNYNSYSYHLDSYYPGWMIMGQAPGITKWTGIERYIEAAFGVIDRIVVVGDNANDMPMLERAHLAVGVEGGHSDVVEIAHEVVQSPSDGGWADIVDLLA